MDRTRLPLRQRLSYGVGHVLNDLCASMWFSYLLVYFHYVVSFNNILAGSILLIGQISDAIATPFVGLESDRISLCNRYGKRKGWHLLGTLCVLCSFGFLFNLCITCAHAPDWAKAIYYVPFVVIFQFGWATTQISHLSIIPEIASCEHLRVELNAIRYGFTVFSNILIYSMTLLLLQTGSASDKTNDLTPADAPRFQYLTFGALGLGVIFSILFHVGTPEPTEREKRAQNADETRQLIQPTERLTMGWKCWLKEPQFYMIAMLYMCTRLMVNVSQVYLPLYVTDSLALHKTYIAIIPLIVYVTGFVTSLLMKSVNRALGRKWTYFIGLLMIIASCVIIFFIRQNKLPELVFAVGILLGAGGSTVLVTSLSMTADLIGENTESGAFVYGAMSFTDKLSNGLVIQVIQILHPCKSQACCPDCTWFFRDIMVYVPGAVAFAALILLLVLSQVKIGQRRKNADSEDEDLVSPVAAEGNKQYSTYRSNSTPPCQTPESSPRQHVRTVNSAPSDTASCDSLDIETRPPAPARSISTPERRARKRQKAIARSSSPVMNFLANQPHLHPSGGVLEPDGAIRSPQYQ